MSCQRVYEVSYLGTWYFAFLKKLALMTHDAGAVVEPHFDVDFEQWARALEAQSQMATRRIHVEAVAVDSKRVEQTDDDQVALECCC